jgi:hypothetical protein
LVVLILSADLRDLAKAAHVACESEDLGSFGSIFTVA